eukprot:TRINITY_DN759_c1_g1_i2.p1 TRINITY_DN759_c1_g1~~TRINITY_DN759_c1_g1_i2.p1  ORF type:complete len:791 (+),score=206.28 TRINITY_DN759_c1_g1_i2:30-2375(+)
MGGRRMLSRVPEEILLMVWLYLLHCSEGLQACELVCRGWCRLMQRTFWDVACKLCLVTEEQRARYTTPKLAFLSNVHHFQWRHAMWGDISNSTILFETPDDFLVYDAFPNAGQLFEDSLITYTTSTITSKEVKRQRFLTGVLPEKEVEQLGLVADKTEYYKLSNKFKSKAFNIKADMYYEEAVVLTTEAIEVFSNKEPVTVSSPFLESRGMLDTSGLPSQNIAVIHLCRGVAYALVKKPPGIQMWDTATYQKRGFIPLPGVYRWPADDEFYTWRSQERFAFGDPSWYGVLIDDEGTTWAVDVDRGCCARIPTEDPTRKACFKQPHERSTDGRGAASVAFPNPSAPSVHSSIFSGGTTHPSVIKAWADPPNYKNIPDPSLAECDDVMLVPANVRVCGACVLLWGGRCQLDDPVNSYDEDVTGRAFVQLWKATSVYNLNSKGNDLVCVLQAKYDHLLMAHTDGHRVYVLFHPFFSCDSNPSQAQHIQHLAVDVWDANGGGFVCRRLVHDEDRSPCPFIQNDDLSPCLIQIVHGGPEELLYYISQKKDEKNVFALHQLTTLATAKEAAQLEKESTAVNEWWSEMDPEKKGVEKYWDLNLLVGAPPDVKVGSCLGKYGGGDLFKVEGHNGSLRIAIKEKKFGEPDTTCMPQVSSDASLKLIACLYGRDALRKNVLHLPPLRPDFGHLSRSSPPGCPVEFLNAVGPIVSTQLACYQPSKASLVQSSATALVHQLSYLDDIIQKITQTHSGSWDEHFSSAGEPITCIGHKMRATLRDTYLSIAAGMP